MLSSTVSFGINGIEASIINIEADIVKGLPNFRIVGLPDSAIRESKERIRSAIENSGYDFPPRNFVVNLAPAAFKKQGANLDLPIAVSLLNVTGQFYFDTSAIPMVGELSLDGSVRPVSGILSMAIKLYRRGYRKIIVPHENRYEAAAVAEIESYPVANIADVEKVFTGEAAPFRGNLLSYDAPDSAPDFCEVRGQERARRALEIAAAGHHNILLYGSPGSGKTMLARRLPSILPGLSREESIETTMVYSVSGLLHPGSGLITRTPFRSPHHCASDSALIGGGSVPSAGEISLSHNGVLFMDEFTEFRSNVIQSLRQPLEDHEVTVSRAAGSCTFPADFMLVAASNPCPCGNLFDEEIPCLCPPEKVRKYFRRISGPVLERIDIEVLVNRVPYKDLLSDCSSEGSAEIAVRVKSARSMQAARFEGTRVRYNSRMALRDIQAFCAVTRESRSLLETALRRMRLSARSFYKILRVARTIADLEGKENIETGHILEALSYKNLFRNYEV